MVVTKASVAASLAIILALASPSWALNLLPQPHIRSPAVAAAANARPLLPRQTPVSTSSFGPASDSPEATCSSAIEAAATSQPQPAEEVLKFFQDHEVSRCVVFEPSDVPASLTSALSSFDSLALSWRCAHTDLWDTAFVSCAKLPQFTQFAVPAGCPDRFNTDFCTKSAGSGGDDNGSDGGDNQDDGDSDDSASDQGDDAGGAAAPATVKGAAAAAMFASIALIALQV